MTNYIKNSNPCMHAIITNIVKAKIKEYKNKNKKMENQVRSMHVLYIQIKENHKNMTSKWYVALKLLLN